MKIRAVIKISKNGAKSRTNAMKLAVSAEGVTSVEIKGDQNHLVVIGEGIDITRLTTLIRKKIGFTEIVSIAPILEDPETRNAIVLASYPSPSQFGIPPFNSYQYDTPQISLAGNSWPQ